MNRQNNALRGFALVLFALAAVVCPVNAANAATYTWDGADDASWQDPGNYLEEGKPSANDIVIIPRGKNPVVTDTDADFVGSLAKITLQAVCTITFDIENDHTLTCEIRQPEENNASWSTRVYLIKAGNGTLTLSAPYNSVYIYRTGIQVNGGTLRFGDVAGYSSSANQISVVSIDVGASGVLDLNGVAQLNFGNLSGSGIISNDMANTQTYFNQARENTDSEFSGRILGNIQFKPTAKGTTMRLDGVSSDFSSIIAYYDGVVALASFGMAGQASSIGTNGTISLINGGRLEYIGTGETTDKEIPFKSSLLDYVPVIDAGATGGVEFTGRLGHYTTPARMRQLVITGSNANECVISGPWYELGALNGTNFATYITKEGSGIWRFADNASRNHRGVTAVKDGTLRFDSVAEAGAMCSLGLSTVLYDDVNSAVRLDSDAVPYALLVGGTNSTATLEYTGVSDVFCTTRPIGVKGSGRLRNATGYDFFWRNVFGVGDGVSTLALDGDDTAVENQLDTVTNACGTLSIVKEGRSNWTLTGDVAFNGSLTVKDGTLTILRDRATPTWFRWNIMQNFADWLNANHGEGNGKSQSYAAQVDEFALYSADGVRQNKGLTVIDDWTSLAGGQAALMQGTVGTEYNKKLACIFSDTSAASSYGNLSSGQNSSWMRPQTTNTWIRIVMRLKDDSDPVVAYDYANLLANFRPSVYAYSLECSLDGKEWTTVTNVVGASLEERIVEVGGNSVTTNIPWWATDALAVDANKKLKWESNHDTIAANAVRPLSSGAGFPITLPVRSMRHDPISSVSVASNAVLRADIRDGGAVTVAGLSLDGATGVGTFENITFAQEGTVDVVNVPKTGAEFSPILTNCEGFSNVANWSVTKNGWPTTRVKVNVNDGKIRVVAKGTVIVVK